ncbi:MAG: response regulator [Candidatus Manganitrophaceae bacterium]|nr:MAG: response regulator [Candidatus Manganitrophaceae bacterium]
MSETLRQWALDLERKVEERTHELSESKAELERSYQKLQELDQVKTQFFANISHELRTPLTLILAPLESILHRDTLQGDLREDVNSMYQNGLRLLKLINNLLDMAKIDAGKMQLSYIKTDFIKFVKGIIASVSPMAEKKEISLSFSGPDQLSEFYFDRDKLEKVLLNIIFNSLKFTNTRGRVDVSCERRDDHVIVRVSDTGIGIAKENIDKLFNRFSQIDASSNRRFEGTGIGLALSKELIELHKGEIWAESELGQGTVMNFTIPYLTDPIFIPEQKEGGEMDWTRSLHKAAEYGTAGVVQEAQPTQSTTTKSTPAGAPKILVVEDNPDMLHFLVTQLQDDYQVITAQNGVDGIQRAQSDLPNLILSDVMMPIKDGYQLCREIKENSLTKQIPVVLISAKADLSMKIEGLEYGADDYLTKPFSCEELRARIKSLLNQRGLEAQLIHSEKMAALGLLVAGMAHEINNPINFAKMSLENLSKALTEHNRLMEEGAALDSPEVKRLDDKINRAFSIIATGLDRTEAIISDLKAFVRKDEAQFRPTDLHAGLDSTLNLLGPELKDRITISKEYGEIGLIEAVPGQINQVFMNLLQNAIHAIPGEGEIQIKTWKEEERVKISVKDSGTGISPEHQKRIFEPFFTTKEVGKGTGLGLSVSYRILQSHNGQIAVISQPRQGTEFVITLPVRQTVTATHQNR